MAFELETSQVNGSTHETESITKIIGPIGVLMTGTLSGTTAVLMGSPDNGTTWQSTGAEDNLTPTEAHKIFFTSPGFIYKFEITGTNRATVKIWWSHHPTSNYFNLPIEEVN